MPDRFSYQFDRFVVEPHTARLLRDGESVTLEPKSFRVLLFLLEHRDRLVDKQELLDGVWPDAVVTENAVTRAVARLRKALEDDPREPRFVATVHTRGYRFVAPVEEVPSPDREPSRGDEDPDERGVRPRSWLSRPPARLGLAVALALLLTAAIARVYDGPAHPSRPAAPASDAGTLDPRRIAVLPMVDLRGDEEDAHVADGLTEQMISVLSRIDGVRTVPRTSVMVYKDSPRRVSEIGRELGAGTVLEGSLSSGDEGLRITVRLIDVDDEETLWSTEVDCSLIDFFEVQRDVALQIGKIFQTEISSEELRSIARGPTREITAYEHYLRGRAFHRQLTRLANEKAIAHYQMALELDPNFALAHAGLANAYGNRIIHFGFDPEEGSALALAAAQRALELDPELPEAYQAIGIVEFRRSKIRSALGYTQKALELNPDYDEALFNASLINYSLGRWDESLFFALRDRNPPTVRLANYALRLGELGFDALAGEMVDVVSSKDPLNLVLGYHLASRSLYDGDLRAARTRVDRLIESHRDSRFLHSLAGEIEWRAGDRDEALGYFERALLLGGNTLDSELRAATIRWLRDADPEAAATLDRLAADAKREIENGSEWERDAWTVAAVEANRGTVDEAMRWYEKAVDAGRRFYSRDAGEPLFASLRDDPRFIAQLDRMRADVVRMHENVARETGPDLSAEVHRAWASAP